MDTQSTTAQLSKILVVDDTPNNLRLLASILKEKGYEIKAVTSGRMALTVTHRLMPELILLDICMPEMDGYEVCQALKANPQTSDIPIIFLSALDDVSDKVKAFKFGGVDYITKPFQVAEVLARVEMHLDLRRLQQQLQAQNIRLQEEIKARQQAEAEVRKALDKEKELNILKSRFVAMVSHEFRTPLTTIQTTSDLLQYYEWTAEERKSYFEQIRLEVQYMTELIEDVLVIGEEEIGSPQVNSQVINLAQFCQSLLTSLQRTAGSRYCLTFTSQGEPQDVSIDPKLLRQILNNLLSNAIKYSCNGGSVTLTVIYQPDRVLLQVKDQGIGIPVADQERLFEAFHRAANVEAIQGTGLGLAIAQKCTELCGGEISFESQLNQGTTFTVALPLICGGRLERIKEQSC
jgi:two-component system, sensor histidine kinase and response regulator